MSEHEGKDEKKVTEGQWTTGLYDCLSEDISTCKYTVYHTSYLKVFRLSHNYIFIWYYF